MVNDVRARSGHNSVLRKQSFVCAASGDLAALAYYLANGGDIDAKDEEGMALIHCAASQGNIPLIRKLREHGANLNLPDEGTPPWKPIHYAIFHRQPEAEQALRTLGAETPLPILKRIACEKPRSWRNEKDAVLLAGRS